MSSYWPNENTWQFSNITLLITLYYKYSHHKKDWKLCLQRQENTSNCIQIVFAFDLPHFQRNKIYQGHFIDYLVKPIMIGSLEISQLFHFDQGSIIRLNEACVKSTYHIIQISCLIRIKKCHLNSRFIIYFPDNEQVDRFINHNFVNRMISSQKKIWLEQQDRLLKQLYEEQGIRNWSAIAKKMSSDYNLPRKSAKQCRQRYENHIRADETKAQWTIEEQLMLINLHNQIGNKWSLIAQKIPGKTDNCVKNHFYSKLRKVLRKLNTVIHTYFRKQFREININVIYKIVQACQQQFKQRPGCEQAVSVACREVQNKMLHMSMLSEQSFDSKERVSIYRDIVKQVYTVSKLYKRKSKKSRNSAIQAPTLKLKRKKEAILVSNNNSEQGYQSDQSSVFEGQEQISSEQEKPQTDQKRQQIHHQKTVRKQHERVVVKDEEQGIKDLLKEAGLLIQQKQESNTNIYGFKQSSRSSFKSYSENNNDSDQHFFEDSDYQKGFLNNKKPNYLRHLDDPSQKSDKQGPQELFFN